VSSTDAAPEFGDIEGADRVGNRRRRVDILLRGARIAAFVDGCFWHTCPDHNHLPKANTSWWRLKFRGSADRDATPTTQLAAAGWLVVRI
jgi:DNA mismatch endonuclease (patch repair protein)